MSKDKAFDWVTKWRWGCSCVDGDQIQSFHNKLDHVEVNKKNQILAVC